MNPERALLIGRRPEAMFVQDIEAVVTALVTEVERLRGMEARARRWLMPDRAANDATMYGRGCLDTAREILRGDPS